MIYNWVGLVFHSLGKRQGCSSCRGCRSDLSGCEGIKSRGEGKQHLLLFRVVWALFWVDWRLLLGIAWLGGLILAALVSHWA